MDEYDEDLGQTDNLTLEQRSTEKMLNDLRTSGYRDGRQRHMEDEERMQAGFDTAYKRLVRLGFQTGRVRASVVSLVRKDSALLAAVNHRLEMIETFAYECCIGSDTDKYLLLDTVSNIFKKLA